MKALSALFALSGLALGAALPASAQGVMLSAGYKGASSISASGGSATANYPALDLQFAVSDLVAISVGIGSLTYDYTGSDTSAKYTETGKGTALSLDVKFYPGKRRLQGFYVGPGVGMADIKIDWTDKVGTFTRRGTGSGTGTEVHGKAGYAFLAGPLTIDPNLQVGYFVAMPSSNSGRTSTLSVYVLLGLNIGFRF